MSDFFDWDGTQESELMPSMLGLFRIDKVEDGIAKTSGKVMPQVRFVCEEPTAYAGMSIFENFVMGTDEQPGERVSGAMGTKAFKRLCKSAQVPPATSFQQLCAGLVGAKCLINLVYYEEKDGEYKGTPRNRVSGMGADSGYYKLGEREIKVVQPIGGVAGAAVAPPGVVATAPALSAVVPAALPVGAPPVAAVPPSPQAVMPPPVGAAVSPPLTPVDALAAGRDPRIALPPAVLPPGAETKVPADDVPGSMRCTFCQKSIWAVELGHHMQHTQLNNGVCPAPGTYIA